MNCSFRFASFAAALCLAAFSVSADEPGYVDIGTIKPSGDCQFVEVNLHAPVLKLASRFVDHEEPEIAELIRGLKRVRVNVVGYNEANRAETTERVLTLRNRLENEGWTQIVTVQQGEKAEDVAIYLKLADEEAIQGVVVTVLDAEKGEAVIVNVVGEIRPEQLAKLGESLHLEPLADLRVKTKHPRS